MHQVQVAWREQVGRDHGPGRAATSGPAAAAVLCACHWPTERALTFVREPTPRVLSTWARRLDPHLPLRAWLGIEANRPAPAHDASLLTPHAEDLGLGPGRASSLTSAVLSAVGDVVGAGRLLGLDLRDGRQRCPLHHGTSARSLQITRCVWRCWAGCGSGNAIHLAAVVLGLDYRHARAELARRLGVAHSGRSAPRRP